jgi:hypothetical protein
MGEQKPIYLKSFLKGIEEIMYSQIGLNNENNFEQFCKLIFSLTKNFNIIELLSDLNMFSNIYKFMEKCLEYCKY